MWRLVEKHGMNRMCPHQKENMRIGYNKVQPFFAFGTEEPDKDTLESIIITTFLEANKLDATWIWAGNIWGSKGPDGRFNGVVGKVFSNYIIYDILSAYSTMLQSCYIFSK